MANSGFGTKVQYKSLAGKRFIIELLFPTEGMVKYVSLVAYNVDDNSKDFTIVAGVHRFICAQANISIDDERVEKLLFEIGLKLAKDKIDKEIAGDEKKNLAYDDIANIDDKINKIKSPKEEFEYRYRIKNDILGCIYRNQKKEATSKELVDYVWTDSEILLQELWHLDKRKLIGFPRFPKELIDKGGDNDRDINKLVLLTSEGKQEYENMMRENILKMNMNLEPFKNWIPFASNKKVFLAYRFGEKALVDKIKEAFKGIDFDFTEGRVKDLGFITEDILNKIKESGFFLALITPLKEFKDGKFSTSSWILMEIGVAIAYERKVLVLAEDCIEQEEYAKKLQPECQYEVFNRENFESKLAEAISRIKKEWEKHR